MNEEEINNCHLGNLILLFVVLQLRSAYVMSQEREEIPTLDLPAQAIWVPGRKAGTMVLLDPHQVKLRLESKDGKFLYY